MRLIEDLKKIFQEAEKEFQEVKNEKELQQLRIKYLGRKSYLSNFSNLIKNLSVEDKKEIGKLYNDIKEKLENLYQTNRNLVKDEKIKFDFDDPGEEVKIAKQHLITQTFEKVTRIFLEIGFSVLDFNQIVSEKENFDYLNIPVNHPARDLWDTLWVKNKKSSERYLFRTHTSCFQVPIIKKFGVPIRAIVYGKVFRYEATDRTHDFEFLQLDGISISEDTHLGNLKYVIRSFFELFFDKEITVRLRPGYFPFVEPGLEVDIGCIFCNQKGCQVCRDSGFIEVAGAGMIHPFVLKSSGLDKKKYQGYAFGFGLDRLIMLKHGISDIRILHSSDLRFIKQF